MKFIIDILIPNAMGKDVHIRAQQALGIRKIEDVRGNPDAVLVRFIDGSAIQFRSELLKLPVPVIDPELDQVDVAGRLGTNGFPCLLFRIDPMDHTASRLGTGDTQSGGTEPCGACNLFIAQRKRFLGIVRTHAECSADAEPGALPEVVDERVAARIHVHVGIHDHRHDGHPAEVHAGGALRRGNFTGGAHCHDHPFVDDNGRIIYGVRTIACDHPCALVHDSSHRLDIGCRFNVGQRFFRCRICGGTARRQRQESQCPQRHRSVGNSQFGHFLFHESPLSWLIGLIVLLQRSSRDRETSPVARRPSPIRHGRSDKMNRVMHTPRISPIFVAKERSQNGRRHGLRLVRNED